MTDELKIFQAGDKITADETNDNNRYLLGVAQDTSGELQNYIDTQLNQFQNNLNTQISSINTQIAETNANVTSLANSKLSATQSKGGNGYVKFSNGIIIQWGHLSVGYTNPWVTFPTAFTTTNYFAYATFENITGHLQNSWGFPSYKSTTGCNFTIESGNYIGWLAVGY